MYCFTLENRANSNTRDAEGQKSKVWATKFGNEAPLTSNELKLFSIKPNYEGTS